LKRNVGIDVLKLLLTLMVVGLHSGFLVDVNATASYLTVNGLFRIAVPLFLLINGFYFYNALVENRVQQWIMRVAFLYVFWMLVYSYFWIPSFNNTAVNIVVNIVFRLFIGYWHLWYVAGILGAAIILVLTKNIPTNILIFITSILFLTGAAIQYAGNYHVIDNPTIDALFNSTYSHRNFLFFSFPFFYTGYLIKKYGLHKKIGPRQTYLASFIGLLALMSESLLNYMAPTRDGEFDNYLSLMIICPAIFLLVLNAHVEGNSKNIALYANGIYFVHALFVILISKYLHPTLLTFAVSLLSTSLCYIIIKNNTLKKVLL